MVHAAVAVSKDSVRLHRLALRSQKPRRPCTPLAGLKAQWMERVTCRKMKGGVLQHTESGRRL